MMQSNRFTCQQKSRLGSNKSSKISQLSFQNLPNQMLNSLNSQKMKQRSELVLIQWSKHLLILAQNQVMFSKISDLLTWKIFNNKINNFKVWLAILLLSNQISPLISELEIKILLIFTFERQIDFDTNFLKIFKLMRYFIQIKMCASTKHFIIFSFLQKRSNVKLF